jgi:multidrug efflux pump subunit AcrA (membrane-fusion protein)
LKKLPLVRPSQKVVNYVTVKKVDYSDLKTEVSAFGRVGSSQPLDLIAEVGGKLLKGQIEFKEGANFSKGQLLCSIYDTDTRLNVLARKSQFLNMLATTLPDIKYDFPESYDMWKKYFDEIDLEKELPPHPKPKSSKEKTFLASKNLLSEYYSIKSLEDNLRKFHIYAPYSGSIATVSRELGTVVSPGTNIARIIRTDKLELEVPVEIQDIKWVKKGTSVEVVSEDGMNKWYGSVVRVGDFVDPNTHSIIVYIALNYNKENPLYDGSYLKAVIPGKEIKQAIKVPRKIIQNNNKVFIVEHDTLLTAKNINLLKIEKDSVIINGLNPGDLLVTDAPANASNKMTVEILNKEEK